MVELYHNPKIVARGLESLAGYFGGFARIKIHLAGLTTLKG
jgi:hypothetical protein